MRIICIDDSSIFNRIHTCLVYGKEYEAVGEQINFDGDDCYVIPGLLDSTSPKTGKDNRAPIYRKNRFVPISDIDETEFERSYNKELV